MATQPQKPRPSKIRKLSLSGDDGVTIENILPRTERTFLAVGSTLGKYRIIEEIDRGGMAVVYRALQLDLDREVALKVLPANITINRRFVDRFLSEAHSVAKLTHPNIVSIHEVAMEDNVYFLAMDYIRGRNLYYHLHFGKPKLADVVEIVATLADALGYAHGLKIIHRDLKLNNVIMKDDRVPVLIDFGLAKALESDEGSITQTGEIVGSPAYMAPERIMGKNDDSRSDICSLGIMLYEMLTFKNPFLDPRSIHQTTMNVLECNPIAPRKLVAWLSPEIEAITLKAMNKEPENRYQTMEEFRDDLRRYQRGESVRARSPSLWWRAGHFFRRNWAWLSLGALAAVFSVVVGLLLYVQSSKETPHWQLVYRDDFSAAARGEEWTVHATSGDSAWVAADGALRVRGDEFSYVRLDRTFSRDIMIEFDLCAEAKDLYTAGIFLYGDSPDSAYRFYVHLDGRAGGIGYPGTGFLFRDIDRMEFPASLRYHVVVKKSENAVNFTVNDVLVGVFWDFFPVLGRLHQKIGLFAQGGGCSFDNVKVYRLAMPELSGPSLVADRFWERGEIEGALEEYRALLVDFPRLQSRGEIQLRIAECLIRTDQSRQAARLLDELAQSPDIQEFQRPQVAFLQAVLRHRTEGRDSAMGAYARASRLAPYHPVNRTALSLLLLDALDSLRAGRTAWVGATAESLALQYPTSLRLTGELHCALMEYFLKTQAYDEVARVGATVERFYASEPRVLARSRWCLGAALLGRHEKQKAVDCLHRSIGTWISGEYAWRSWRSVAEVYESDFRNVDAFGIYRKIYRDCPLLSEEKWAARVAMAGLARFTETKDSAVSFLRECIDAPHPFPRPRSLALLYAGAIDETEFLRRWRLLGDDGDEALLFLARKAATTGDRHGAEIRLKKLKSRTPVLTWRYVQIERLLWNLAQW